MDITTVRRIRLTPEEMAILDDGQGWYKPGDECWLGGYTEQRVGGWARSLDLCVNGRTHDNWTYMHELPQAILDRLIASDD